MTTSSRRLGKYLLIVFFLSLSCLMVTAQSPGLIVRPASGNGVTPLNPNGDGFSSATAAGFKTSDITESEIPYKIVPPAVIEPVGDLLRGPSGLYSDLVKEVDGSGFYVWNDGTNLLFRIRIGGIVSGSKGYSVLIDTDSKFGATGPSADPNYQAATTGTNGNPGFELEVTLETNFRVALYNVDGGSSPVLLQSYDIDTHSQISVALSTVSGDADYFYDFYVPISAMGITASTPLRMTTTTVMAPTAAIGGPKSDIYGVDDSSIKDAMTSWEEAIESQPAFTLNDVSASGSGVSSTCTAAPTLSSPLVAGSSVTVSGTWTAMDASKPSSATITVYVNGVSKGTTTASSGGSWSLAGLVLANGDIVYAKAQASGESQCLESNHVKVVTCSSANTSTTTGLSFSCSSAKGMEGARPANAAVKLYLLTTSGTTLVADDNSTTYRITYPSTTTWRYDAAGGNGNPSACSGGSNDVADGSYRITATEPGKCESAGVSLCLGLTAATTPVISQTNLYDGATSVSGTATSGALVRLSKNGVQQATTTATGGNYSFTGLALATGDVVTVTAQATGGCVSAAASRTVTCYTAPPVITTDNNGSLTAGATSITGTSSEPAGTVVTVYENAVSIGTTAVQSDGTWSLTYTLIASRSYTAAQKNGSCAMSSTSSAATALAATTVCPTITGTYTETATQVTGTLSASFSGTVRLYQDGSLVGSVTVSSATSWSIPVNTTYANKLYNGGTLTATTQSTGAAEKTNCSGSTTVTCSTPATPVFSPTSSSVPQGQTVTFSLNSTTSGILYSVKDNSTTTYYANSSFGTGSSMDITTYQFSSTGTYDVLLQATSLSGTGCESFGSASIMVYSVLPLTLVQFNGQEQSGYALLQWMTSSESNTSHFQIERSADGRTFTTSGTVQAAGNSTTGNAYRFKDPVLLQGNTWYRLKMVDNDGKSTYSQVVMVKPAAEQKLAVTVKPNPFQDRLVLEMETSRARTLSIRLSDATGRVVRVQQQRAEGNSTLSIGQLGTVVPGVYLLQVLEDNQVIWQQRVVKAGK